ELTNSEALQASQGRAWPANGTSRQADGLATDRGQHGEMPMRNKLGIAMFTALLASALAVQAQGIPRGAQRGAEEGSAVGGPVGGVVGGAVDGLLGVDAVPRFREYVVREHRSVYVPGVEPQVGVILPPNGITYYAVPPAFGIAPRYRYAIVNDYVVLVDPGTREVVEVID